MTESELRAHVLQLLADTPYRGNQSAFCRDHGITRHASLSEFLNGSPPRRSLLNALQVEVEVTKTYSVKGNSNG